MHRAGDGRRGIFPVCKKECDLREVRVLFAPMGLCTDDEGSSSEGGDDEVCASEKEEKLTNLVGTLREILEENERNVNGIMDQVAENQKRMESHAQKLVGKGGD